jgi:hypothetical protein
MLDSLYIYYYMSLVRLKGTDILEKTKKFLFYNCYLKLPCTNSLEEADEARGVVGSSSVGSY